MGFFCELCACVCVYVLLFGIIKDSKRMKLVADVDDDDDDDDDVAQLCD